MHELRLEPVYGSFLHRLAKNSLKAQARLDYKLAKLRKARARNDRTSLVFVPNSLKTLELGSIKVKDRLGSEPISESRARLELARSHSQKARARSTREIHGSGQHYGIRMWRKQKKSSTCVEFIFMKTANDKQLYMANHFHG